MEKEVDILGSSSHPVNLKSRVGIPREDSTPSH